MKELLSKLDRGVYSVVAIFLGTVVLLLTLVINIQVVARYVLNVSLGGLEEAPVYLMMVCVWIAAPFIARSDGHVKIDFINMIIKNPIAQRILKTAIRALTTVVLATYTVFAYDYVLTSYQLGEVTPGLQIPLWCLQAFVLFGSSLMAVYYLINTVKAAKEVMEIKGGN